MDQFGGSSRSCRSDSFLATLVRRSHSSRLILETSSVAAECALITRYQRLSQSMRSPILELPPSPSPPPGRQAGVGRILARFFDRKLGGGLPDAEKATKKSTSSDQEGSTMETKSKRKRRRWRRWPSWLLPDPDRRWPVQGW